MGKLRVIDRYLHSTKAPALADFDTWWQSYRHFLSGSPNSIRTGNPDGDASDNFAESAFLGDPNSFDGSPSAVEAGVSGFEYVFRRNRGVDFTFRFQ